MKEIVHVGTATTEKALQQRVRVKCQHALGKSKALQLLVLDANQQGTFDMTLVVVSAARFEAEPFLQSEISPKLGIQYISCGIGALNAAKTELMLAEACQGKEVIFIGTCGSFYPFSDVHLVQIQKVYWLPTCERAGFSSSIEGIHPPFYLPASPPWLDLPSKIAICGPAISHQNVFAANFVESLEDTSQLVENLELYSCIQGIAQTCKSLAVILGVTNEVCEKGRKQWRDYHLEAAEMTAKYLQRKLK